MLDEINQQVELNQLDRKLQEVCGRIQKVAMAASLPLTLFDPVVVVDIKRTYKGIAFITDTGKYFYVIFDNDEQYLTSTSLCPADFVEFGLAGEELSAEYEAAYTQYTRVHDSLHRDGAIRGLILRYGKENVRAALDNMETVG